MIEFVLPSASIHSNASTTRSLLRKVNNGHFVNVLYNACKMAEAEVKEWLRSIPASVGMEKTYFQKLIDKGYDDLKMISTLPVNILDEVLEVPKVHGHIKKFEVAI